MTKRIENSIYRGAIFEILKNDLFPINAIPTKNSMVVYAGAVKPKALLLQVLSGKQIMAIHDRK